MVEKLYASRDRRLVGKYEVKKRQKGYKGRRDGPHSIIKDADCHHVKGKAGAKISLLESRVGADLQAC